MASFDDVLARIPGYGGFHAKRQMNDREDAADFQHQVSLLGIQQKLQAQREAQAEKQTLQQISAQSGGNLDAIVQAALRAGRPDIAAKLAPLVEAQRKAQPQAQSIGSGGLLKPDGTIVPPAARPAPPAEVKPPPVRQRYDGTNVIQEQFVDGKWVEIGRGPRFQPPAPEKPPKLPTPKAGYRWNAAGTEQERIPGGPVDVKFKSDQAQAKKSVGLAIENMGALDKAIADLETDPGLPRITGSMMGRTPNVTNLATGAQAKLDSLKSQIFVSALQAMREASKTGGAVGSVTEKEGDKLENSLAALAQAQGTSDFQNQLRIARSRLTASQELIRKAYEEQFGEKWASAAPAAPTPPAASGGLQEGQTGTSKTGKPIVVRGGKWVYQ